MSNSYESGKIMEILNNGISVLNSSLKDINKNLKNIDEGIQLILIHLYKKDTEIKYDSKQKKWVNKKKGKEDEE